MIRIYKYFAQLYKLIYRYKMLFFIYYISSSVLSDIYTLIYTYNYFAYATFFLIAQMEKELLVAHYP